MFDVYGKVRLSDLFLLTACGEEKPVKISAGFIEGVGTHRRKQYAEIW